MLNLGVRILNRLNMPQKMLAIAVIFLLPIVFLLVMYMLQLNAQIAFTERELRGVQQIAPARQMIQSMQLHRGLSQQALVGNAAAVQRLQEVRGKIRAAIDEVESVDQQVGSDLGTHEGWMRIKGAWQALEARADTLTPESSFKEHTEAIGLVRDFIISVADQSNMTLDQEIETHYLVEALATKLVRSIEATGITRAVTLKVIGLKNLGIEERLTLNTLLRSIDEAQLDIEAGLDKATRSNERLRNELLEPRQKQKDALSAYTRLLREQVLQPALVQAQSDETLKIASAAIDAGYGLNDAARNEFSRLASERVASLKAARIKSIAAVVVTLLLVAYLFLSFRSSLLDAIGALANGAKRMADGNFLEPVAIGSRDELGDIGAEMNRTQKLLREKIEAERETANANLRIRIALDNVSTGVMIANPERKIIYVNKAVERILKGAEAGIRSQLPNFNADQLLGADIDSFHKNPAHQAQLLATFTSTHTANFEIGGCHLRVSASPVINEQGMRLGAVAEWLDRTGEVRVEREVANMVDSAQRGDFEQRLSLEGKEGFFRQVSVGLNRLAEVTSAGLQDVARVLKSVAAGDLTQTVAADYEGIFGELKNDTNATVERLREVIGRIRTATEAINTASQEIAAGNADLSSRTEQQASSLEETSSSMEQLNATVKNNSENARKANDLAKDSNAIASRGGDIVRRVVTTMADIQDSSKKIADIIGVIDSIAFQTNSLARNAAVEAARAGEQGRGFAVVASEVRNLAQRSATAAKEIKSMIDESVGQVDDGAKQVADAGATMDDVVASFHAVAELVTDIAHASREQSSGIEQVTQAVSQMDEMTQQNAALVEQAAAAAESLQEQASGLVQVVSLFRIEGAATVPAAPQKRATVAAPARIAPQRKPVPAAHADDPDEAWAEF